MQAEKLGVNCVVGNIYSTDLFYLDHPDRYKPWIDHGVLAVDMETSALYTIAAKSKGNAVAIRTVRDNIITGAISGPDHKVCNEIRHPAAPPELESR